MLSVHALLTRILASVALAAVAVAPALGDDKPPATAWTRAPGPRLAVGDKAPAVDISDWIKGEKIAAWKPGEIYVVEFWATWCVPCRASLPYLSALQARYRDAHLTVIGVSQEPRAEVERFIAKAEWEPKTRYTIATDPDGDATAAYVQAAGQTEIPVVFVIGRDGTIQWIGNPLKIDEPIERIVRNTWDVKAARKRFEESQLVSSELGRRQNEIFEARAAGDWKKVVAIYDELLAKAPDAGRLKIGRFIAMAGGLNDAERAYAYAREIIAAHGDDPLVMNDLAWYIVDDASIHTRDLDLALAAATKANDLTGGTSAAIIDTLATVYWHRGEKARALELEQVAVDKATGAMKESLQKTLELWRSESEKLNSDKPKSDKPKSDKPNSDKPKSDKPARNG